MRKIVLVFMICLLSACTNKKNDTYQNATIATIESNRYSASLFMVGDALLHNAVYNQVAQADGTYDFSEMMKTVGEVSQGYDLKFYNQETILGGVELGLSSYPCFNSPQEFGDLMMSYGFNLVALANNHTLDKGTTGVMKSMEYWDKQQTMTAGSYSSFEARDEIQIGEINGITYTLLSYTYGTNGIVVPVGKEYLVNVYTDEMIKEDIARVTDQVDVLIVSMHWGVEYTHTPTDEQVRLANLLADAGVDLVIGHHPHVIQPIEYIGDTLVYYSLGNLVSAQDGIMKTTGMMGSVIINKLEINGQSLVSIDEPCADLLFTTYGHGYSNLKVQTVDQIANYQSIYNEYSKIINKKDESIKVGLK